MRARLPRSGLVWVALLVTAVFTYLAVRNVRVEEVWQAMRSSNIWWLAPALATLALAIFIRALRWRFLFAAETRPPLRAVVSALLVGYLLNNVLPLRAGEAARIVALNQRAGTSRAESLATVVLERAYDVLSLLVLLFLALPWLPEVTWLRAAATLALALAVVLGTAIAALALLGDRPIRFAAGPLTRLSFLPAERIERAALNLAHGLAGLRRARLAAGGLLWTTLSWIVLGVSFWLVMLAFDLDLSPIAGLFVVIAIGLAMILPSGPGAVGVFEAATILALGAYGISESRALSYALVLHALNFFPFLVAGAVALRFARARVGGRPAV